MTWEDILKREPVRIHFLSDKKLTAHISDKYGSGRGPYTIDSIYANLKKDGTYDSRLEFVDGKQVFPVQTKSPIEDKDTRFSDE